jgi:hypothetical protein
MVDPLPTQMHKEHNREGSVASQSAITSETVLVGVYGAITARRSSFDSMMWQVPALAVTAQAFLLTIALGSSTASIARQFAAGLALVLALMAIQLMAKHRFLEEVDSILAEKLEEAWHIPNTLGVAAHARASSRVVINQRRFHWWISRSSYRIWTSGLSLFALVDLSAGLIATVKPGWFA